VSNFGVESVQGPLEQPPLHDLEWRLYQRHTLEGDRWQPLSVSTPAELSGTYYVAGASFGEPDSEVSYTAHGRLEGGGILFRTFPESATEKSTQVVDLPDNRTLVQCLTTLRERANTFTPGIGLNAQQLFDGTVETSRRHRGVGAGLVVPALGAATIASIEIANSGNPALAGGVLLSSTALVATAVRKITSST